MEKEVKIIEFSIQFKPTTMMTHKGYAASVWFDPDDHAFHGTVTGIKDVIHFTGSSFSELDAKSIPSREPCAF